MLPSAWLDRQAGRILGVRNVASLDYRREILRWRIHDALDGLHDARIGAYLRGHDVARRRFQLADRLARIYTQYLVYRPDWLQAWAAGRDPVGDSGFHLPLWRELRARTGMPHRGERLARLLAAFVDGPILRDDEPLHVFGISHLAPSELALLRAVSETSGWWCLYVPDPCRRVTGADLRRELPAASQRAESQNRMHRWPRERQPSILEQSAIPLLAGTGAGIGQHFLLALDEGSSEVLAIDERHYLDKPSPRPPIEPANRLTTRRRASAVRNPALIAGQSFQRGVRRAERDRPLPAHPRLAIPACANSRSCAMSKLRDALATDALPRGPHEAVRHPGDGAEYPGLHRR